VPMRILHVAPYFEDAWAYGGVPRVVGALAAGLARRGHQVTVATTDACDAHQRLTPGPDSNGSRRAVIRRRGAEIRIFPNVSNWLAYHLQFFVPLGLDRYLRVHAGGFDVAHLHACHNLPVALASRRLLRAGVPYALAPHGTGPRSLERRQLAKLAFDATVGRHVLSSASLLLAVSRAEGRQLQAIGAAPERIGLIPNPIDLGEFEPPVERGRFRPTLPRPDDQIVLFLGKLTAQKRLDVLARAFARLRPARTTLVVAGNDMGYARMLRQLVTELGLKEVVVLPGLLEGRRRLEALADADVVVYATKGEIFGLVPLEAILCGTPVIVADDSGCGELIAEIGGGQIIAEGDIDALSEAIRYALDHRDDGRASTIDAGRQIRRRFGADAVCARLEVLYERMAGREAGSP